MFGQNFVNLYKKVASNSVKQDSANKIFPTASSLPEIQKRLAILLYFLWGKAPFFVFLDRSFYTIN